MSIVDSVTSVVAGAIFVSLLNSGTLSEAKTDSSSSADS